MTIRTQDRATATSPAPWTSFDQLAAAVSARLISAPDADLDQGVQVALGWIGEFFEVDRVSVWKYREEDAKFRMSSRWQATVAPAPPDMPDPLCRRLPGLADHRGQNE